MHTLKTNECFHPHDPPLTVEWIDSRQQTGSPPRGYHKIVIILAGHALHVTRGTSCPVGVADTLVVRESTADEYREEQNLRLINIFFRPESLQTDLLDLPQLPGYQQLFSMRLPDGKILRLSPKQFGTVLFYAETLANELREKTPGYAFLAHALFMQLVGYLSRADRPSDETNPRALNSVGKALSYLEAHFDEAISLDELARLAHMSKRNFNRAFRAATHCTPTAYLLKLRLTHAAAMLRQYEHNVTSVAYEVGYHDSNYFARRFHSMFGIPPSEYRKQQGPRGNSPADRNFHGRSVETLECSA
jgi:AraC-like DNA-binding protein